MDVVPCFEVDVFGVDCAAFDCHVFFSNQGQPFLLMALSVFRFFTLNLYKTQS